MIIIVCSIHKSSGFVVEEQTVQPSAKGSQGATEAGRAELMKIVEFDKLTGQFLFTNVFFLSHKWGTTEEHEFQRRKEEEKMIRDDAINV